MLPREQREAMLNEECAVEHEQLLCIAAPHLVSGLKRYIIEGIATGGFLRAVLSDRLFDSVVSADTQSLLAIPLLVKYIFNYAPSQCWGSEEKVNAWIKACAEERKRELQNANS